MARVEEATSFVQPCSPVQEIWLSNWPVCAVPWMMKTLRSHPCSQNMLFGLDLLILILSWIRSPLWGSRKQMTWSSGEVPKKVSPHCLRGRDTSCLLPSLEQSLWIVHLLEDMGSVLSQGSSQTIFTPLRGTVLPCRCCLHVASVFGYPQSTPCPLYWCKSPSHCCVSA